jgi:hypothetical protein
VTVADLTAEAAAAQGTNDTFIRFDGTVSQAGTCILYVALPNIPTKIDGFTTKIQGIDGSIAKVDAATTTAYIDKIGIYQIQPTANSVNLTITEIASDATDRMVAAQSATPVDFSIDLTPTEVGEGMLLLGITLVAVAEAIDWKFYFGAHGGVRVQH